MTYHTSRTVSKKLQIRISVKISKACRGRTGALQAEEAVAEGEEPKKEGRTSSIVIYEHARQFLTG